MRFVQRLISSPISMVDIIMAQGSMSEAAFSVYVKKHELTPNPDVLSKARDGSSGKGPGGVVQAGVVESSAHRMLPMSAASKRLP